MVKILYTKAFLSQFKKLPENIKEKARIAIKKFKANPRHPSLATHKLGGALQGLMSFSVDYQTRIVFELPKEKETAILLKIGDHEVYR